VWNCCTHISSFGRDTNNSTLKIYRDFDHILKWKDLQLEGEQVIYKNLLHDLSYLAIKMQVGNFVHIIKMAFETANHGINIEKFYPNLIDIPFIIDAYLVEFVTSNDKRLTLQPPPNLDYKVRVIELERHLKRVNDEHKKELANLKIELKTQHSDELSHKNSIISELNTRISELEMELDRIIIDMYTRVSLEHQKMLDYQKNIETKRDTEIEDLKAKLEITQLKLSEAEKHQQKLKNVLAMADVHDLVIEMD
jgi:hypothetical protein